jgi:hypothetical protein
LTPESIELLRDAEAVIAHIWPSVEAVGATAEERQAAETLRSSLGTERPWEGALELAPVVERLREGYRSRRRAFLEAHDRAVEGAIEGLKRVNGFERLTADERHRVLSHLRDGAARGTDERAVAPPLEALETLLATKRVAAASKARAELDALLEGMGETPVVEVAVELSGREIETEAELDRLLAELRRRVLHELAVRHRVRLR